MDAKLDAAADDTDFLFRLGMLEGHLIIGHDLIRANRPNLAVPHFGHPVRELYDEIADYIKARRIPAFEDQLIRLEAAMTAQPGAPATEQLYQSVIATVHKARETTPAALRASIPEMIKVCADTIDAASGEYGQSLNRGQITEIVEYHDSRGYVSYVTEELARMRQSHPDAASQSLLDRFQTVLAKAQWIVEPLLPGASPRASVGQYRSVASEAKALTR